jgi:hypothetical protein
MTTNDTARHERLREGLAEQALGTLDGRARAELLDHVAQCPECAAELEGLAGAVDALVLVVPGHEPPVGFESSVMARIRAGAAPRVAPRRRVLAVAAIVAVLAAFGAGWAASGATDGTATRSGHVASRPFAAQGRTVGAAYVYTGAPAWMFVAVDLPGAPSTAGCVVVGTDGTRHDLGTFPLIAGKGAWGATLPVSYSSLRQVLLTSPSGEVVARLRPSHWAYRAGTPRGARGAISMPY